MIELVVIYIWVVAGVPTHMTTATWPHIFDTVLECRMQGARLVTSLTQDDKVVTYMCRGEELR